MTVVIRSDSMVAPEVPTGFRIETATSNSVSLRWDTSDDEYAKAVEVWRSDDGVNFSLIRRAYRAVAFTDRNLTPGITYTYKIRLMDIYDIFSDYSSELTKTIAINQPIWRSYTMNVSTGYTELNVESSLGRTGTEGSVAIYGAGNVTVEISDDAGNYSADRMVVVTEEFNLTISSRFNKIQLYRIRFSTDSVNDIRVSVTVV